MQNKRDSYNRDDLLASTKVNFGHKVLSYQHQTC